MSNYGGMFLKAKEDMDAEKLKRFEIQTALKEINIPDTTKVELAIELSKFKSIHEHVGVLSLLNVLKNDEFTDLPDDSKKWIDFIKKMIARDIPYSRQKLPELFGLNQEEKSIPETYIDFLSFDAQKAEWELKEKRELVYEAIKKLIEWDKHQIPERLVAQLKNVNKFKFTERNTSDSVLDPIAFLQKLGAFGLRLIPAYNALPEFTRASLINFAQIVYRNSPRILAAQKSRGFDTLLAYIGQQDSPTELLESILVNEALIDKLKENLKEKLKKDLKDKLKKDLEDKLIKEKEEIANASDISILLSSFIQLEAGEELSVMRVMNSLNEINREQLNDYTRKILTDMSIIVNKVGFDTPAILSAIVNSGLIELLIDKGLVNNETIGDLSNIIKWVLKNILGESLGFDDQGAKDLCTVVRYILENCDNKDKLKEVIKCVLQQPFDLNKVLDYVFQMDIVFIEDSGFHEALSSYIINFLTKYDENTQALSDIGLNGVFVKKSNFHGFLTDILKAILAKPDTSKNEQVMNLNLLMDALYPFDLNRFLIALSRFNDDIITTILQSSQGKGAIEQIITQLSTQSGINLSPSVIRFIREILEPDTINSLLQKIKNNVPTMVHYDDHSGEIALLNQSERNCLFSHQQEDDLILEFRAVLDKHDKEVSLSLSKADITSIIELPINTAQMDQSEIEQLLISGTNPKALLAFGIPIEDLARIRKKIASHSSQAKYATFWKRYDDLLKAAELDQTKDSELIQYLNKETASYLEEEIALYKDLSDMSKKCRWVKLLRAVKTDYHSFSVKCNAVDAIKILDNIHKNLQQPKESTDYRAIKALYDKLQAFKNGDDPDFDAKVINLIKTKLRNKETDLFDETSELLMSQKLRSDQYEKGQDPLVKLYKERADIATSPEKTKVLYQPKSLGPILQSSMNREEALKLFEAMTKTGSPLQKLNKLIKKPITDFLTPNQTTIEPTTPPNGKKTKRDLLISTLAKIDTRTLSDDGPKMTAKDLCNLLSINIIEEHVAEAGNISIREKDIINLCKLLDSLKDGNFSLSSFKSGCLSCREIIKLVDFLINKTEYSKSLWLGFLQLSQGQLEQLKGIIKLTDEIFNMENIGDTSQLFQHQFPHLIKMIAQLNPGDKDGLIDMFAKNYVKSIYKIEDDSRSQEEVQEEYDGLKQENTNFSGSIESTDEQSVRQYLKNDVSIRYYEWMKYGGQKADNDEKIRSFFLSEFYSGNEASQALLQLKIKLRKQSLDKDKKKTLQEIDALEKIVKSNESMIRTLVSTCQNEDIANLFQVISGTESDELFDTTIRQFHKNGMHTMIALADHFHTGYPFEDLAKLINQLPTIKKYSEKIKHIKDIFGIKHTENRDRVTDLVQYLKNKYPDSEDNIRLLVGNIIDNRDNILYGINDWSLGQEEKDHILQRWKMTQYGYEHLAKRFKGTMAHTFDLKSVMFIPYMEKQAIDRALNGELSDRGIPADSGPDPETGLNQYKISYLQKIADNCRVEIPDEDREKISLFDRLNDIDVDISRGIVDKVVSENVTKLQGAFDEQKKRRVTDAVRSGYIVDTKTSDKPKPGTRLEGLLNDIMNDNTNPIRRKEYTQGFFFKKQQFNPILSSGVSMGHVSATRVLMHVAKSLITDTTMNIVTSKLLGVDVDCDEEYDPYQILQYKKSTLLEAEAHIQIYDALDFIVKRQECLKLLEVSEEIGNDYPIDVIATIDDKDFDRNNSTFNNINEMKNFAKKLFSGKYKGYALQCCRYLNDQNIQGKLRDMRRGEGNIQHYQSIAPSFYKNFQKIIKFTTENTIPKGDDNEEQNDDSQKISLFLRQKIADNMKNLVHKFLDKLKENDESINHVLRFLDSIPRGGVLKPLSKSDYEPLRSLVSDLVHDIRFIAESIKSELKIELLSLDAERPRDAERIDEINNTIEEMSSQSDVERLLVHIVNYLNWRTGNYIKNKGFNSLWIEFNNGVMSLLLIIITPIIAIYKFILWLKDQCNKKDNESIPTLNRNLNEVQRGITRSIQL